MPASFSKKSNKVSSRSSQCRLTHFSQQIEPVQPRQSGNAVVDAAGDLQSLLIAENELHGPADLFVVFNAIADRRPEATENRTCQHLRSSRLQMRPRLVEVEREMPALVLHDAVQQLTQNRV